MFNPLVALKDHIQKKYPEGQYLYKSCSPLEESWIVVLQLTSDSVTTQSRLSVDNPNRKYAKFRASKVKVIDIINKFDQTKTIDFVRSSGYDIKTKYVRDITVFPDSFDTNLKTVCSSGIHFFESIEAAFYFELNLKKYTGRWMTWFDDGEKSNEGEVSDGIEIGRLTTWYKNGQKYYEGNYSNGKQNGISTTWYENGQPEETLYHSNGRLINKSKRMPQKRKNY